MCTYYAPGTVPVDGDATWRKSRLSLCLHEASIQWTGRTYCVWCLSKSLNSHNEANSLRAPGMILSTVRSPATSTAFRASVAQSAGFLSHSTGPTLHLALNTFCSSTSDCPRTFPNSALILASVPLHVSFPTCLPK